MTTHTNTEKRGFRPLRKIMAWVLTLVMLLGGGAVTLNNTGASSGWYSVSGNVTYTGTITISGDVHIILIDNSNLTVNGSLINAGINVTGTNSLTIHS